MRSLRSCFTLTFFLLALSSEITISQGAGVTINPTDLKGVTRGGSNVRVTRALNENGQLVNANATVSRVGIGTDERLVIAVGNPQVRAITIEVTNAVAQPATLQTVLVNDQTIAVALPIRYDCVPNCICVPSQSHRVFRCRR